MAIKKTELYRETSRDGVIPMHPAEGPGAVLRKSFAPITGGPDLPIGLPMKLASGKLTPLASLASGSTEDVAAFVYPAIQPTDASNDVIGTAMFRGSINFKDAVAAQTSYKGSALTATELTNLTTILKKSGLRVQGILVDQTDLLN